jgi:pimeloyl-ACP methyl ester carboxylesterase
MTLTQLSISLAGSAILALGAFAPAYAEPVKNVVIVHGALADGSGWRKVHNLLTAKGYNVTIVQPPMTTLADDVQAAKRILDLQEGPSILVGHSYGGMVITEAGNADNVAGLVYIAAFQPDEGESLLQLAERTPPATTGIKATEDGFLYLDPAVYAEDFAADVPKAEAKFMAASQVFPSKVAFEAKIEKAAWKTKKSWALIATDDRAIHPDLMRTMAKRAGSTSVEVKGSHAVFMSQPDAVVRLIEKAVRDLPKMTGQLPQRQ